MAELVTQALQGRVVGGGQSGDDVSSQGLAASRPRLPPSATPAPHLTTSASLREFSAWREKYRGYRLLTGLDSMSVPEQRAALLALLDDEWTRVVRYSLDVDDATAVDAVLDRMESYLRSQRSVILDRKDFYTRPQADGEPFDDYLMALKELAEFCDFCSHCMDDRLRDRIVTGIRSEETVQLLLAEPALTLQKTIDICRAKENAMQNSAELRGSFAHAVSAYRRGRSRDSRGRWDGQGGRNGRHRRDSRDERETRQRQAIRQDGSPSQERRCGYCGGKWHPREQLASCPARNTICGECGIKGHYTSVCRKARRANAVTDFGEQTSDRLQLNDVRVQGVTANKTPQVSLHVRHQRGEGTLT